MSTLKLLEEHKIKTAIIVDDGLDQFPLAEELIGVDNDWTVFWDDLSEADKGLLLKVYPTYENTDAQALMSDQEFIGTVFEARAQFESAALVDIFSPFLLARANVEAFVDRVQALLESWGMAVERVGRDFVDRASKVDLIVVDLFLGSAQQGNDKDRSIDGLRKVLSKRNDEPPSVILTSAHNDLNNLRHDFRDETGLHASGFRALSKADIVKDGHLEQVVNELITHRKNSLKLRAFINCWKDGMTQAVTRAVTEMRKLDLEDIAHLQALTLAGEGESVGSYLVDVMDQVVMYELEAEEGVIDAAVQLNSMTSAEFPPNAIVGSKDTLSVVRKTLFAHSNRRRLDEEEGFPVLFGDVIAMKPGAHNSKRSIFEGDKERVFLVMTPICDLIRKEPKTKRAVLLVGNCTELNAAAYKKNAVGHYSPILVLEGARRVIVNWDLKHLETVSSKKLKGMLSENGLAYVPCRMREHAAIALQQTLLSEMGRVGEIVPMPSMFPITCSVFYTAKDKSLKKIEIALAGVCVVGPKGTPVLAFDSSQRTAFQVALTSTLEDIYATSVDKVKSTLSADVLNQIFTKGFACKMDDGSKPLNFDVEGKSKELGKVIVNVDASTGFPDAGQRQGMGLIFEIRD
jgi:hypothetical protein